MEWLTLLDGAPLAAQAARLTGKNWPRLAGSDLIGPLLDAAEESGATVGFLGGSYLIQRLLSRRLTKSRPRLVVAGMWAPSRSDLADHNASVDLARTIRSSGVQVLIVGLGKPRQELWMAKYGASTGANVLLAFGAVVDFLAGSIRRAPEWTSTHGLEWAWRLALEPRRLARRYLVDDPPSLLQMRRHSSVVPPGVSTEPSNRQLESRLPLSGNSEGAFICADEPADVVVYIVTYNSEPALEALMSSLRLEARDLRLRVVVADNDSADETLRSLDAYPDAYALSTGGNLGYASGINAARRVAGDTEAVLILNPDLEVGRGAISALYHRLLTSDAGLVVPKLLESDGTTYQSLRREPTVVTAFGDAFFGEKWPSRPAWLAETDYAPESYQHAHRVHWASGAAILVRADLAIRLGDWDEQFFLYSEEVDYFRRARESGETAWYEPSAQMVHHGGGSGTSSELNALLAVNRVRYIRKYHDVRYARWFRNAVALTELLRFYLPTRLGIFRTIMDESSWASLPGPTAAQRLTHVLKDFPRGAVVIPAHNEAKVIGATLSSLAPVLKTGRVDIIVACNGCHDDTATIAKAFDGVRVLEVETASKISALNAADSVATAWPRLYLDADIAISPTALRMLFDRLEQDSILAARPAFRYDDGGASWLVKAFYRARRRIPTTNEALWGAGAYALAERGHARFGKFPAVTADDLYVDQQFTRDEKVVLHTPPVQVVTPRNTSALMAILRRNYRGQRELEAGAARTIHQRTTKQSVRELLASVNGPFSAIDAAIYAGFVTMARFHRHRIVTGSTGWERDESSRDARGK
ncbi:WecB/TagA/CpsF family glycosyltransferase [Arthrobacter rhombi]